MLFLFCSHFTACFTGFDHSFMGWDHITKSRLLLVYSALLCFYCVLLPLVWRTILINKGKGVGWLVSRVFFLVFFCCCRVISSLIEYSIIGSFKVKRNHYYQCIKNEFLIYLIALLDVSLSPI